MLDLVIANGTCVLPSGTIAADIGVAGGKSSRSARPAASPPRTGRWMRRGGW